MEVLLVMLMHLTPTRSKNALTSAGMPGVTGTGGVMLELLPRRSWVPESLAMGEQVGQGVMVRRA